MRTWMGFFAIGCVGHPVMEGGGTPLPTLSDSGIPGETDDPGTTDTDGSTTSDGTLRQLCVDEINSYRASLGVPPLGRWEEAEPCADGQARADSESGIAHSAFGECKEWAQNECPGWPGPTDALIVSCLSMMWAEGPENGDGLEHGHYVNMSNPDYTEVTCGFYQTPSGDWWAVQDFR